MEIQVVDSIPRNVLINNLKEQNIQTPRPPHMMKTADLLDYLPDITPVRKEKVERRGTMKEIILAKIDQGLTASEIIKELPDIRPMYVYTVVRNHKRLLKG